jgi:hypothetical protein
MPSNAPVCNYLIFPRNPAEIIGFHSLFYSVMAHFVTRSQNWTRWFRRRVPDTRVTDPSRYQPSRVHDHMRGASVPPCPLKPARFGQAFQPRTSVYARRSSQTTAIVCLSTEALLLALPAPSVRKSWLADEIWLCPPGGETRRRPSVASLLAPSR